MPIPLIEQFESVLGSFSLSKPEHADGWRSFEVSPEAFAIDHTGKQQVDPSITLWVKDHAKLPVEGCLSLGVRTNY